MEESKRFVVTYEAVVLWTVGGLLHSLADLGMWHVTACACCVGSCFAKAGPYFAVCISAILCALSTFAIFWRVEYEMQQGDDDGESEIDWVQWRTVESLQFLVSYFVELATVYFFHFPMMATIFFSGAVWGCLPCIGGRPKEIKRQHEEAKRNLEAQKADLA